MRYTRRRMGLGRQWQPPRQYTSGGPVVNIPIGGAYGGGYGLGGAYGGALNSANAANEMRYQQILGGYNGLARRAKGYLKNAGRTERRDIDRRYRGMASDTYQTLVNRGFANSSLLQTMQQGVERERRSARNDLSERVNQQKLGADMAITQGRLGFMERRTDSGPDTNQMLQLAQGAGRYGGGYGYGGGGGGGPFNPLHPLRQAWMQGAMTNLMFGRGGYSQPTPMQSSRYQNNRLQAWLRRRNRPPVQRPGMPQLGNFNPMPMGMDLG